MPTKICFFLIFGWSIQFLYAQNLPILVQFKAGFKPNFEQIPHTRRECISEQWQIYSLDIPTQNIDNQIIIKKIAALQTVQFVQIEQIARLRNRPNDSTYLRGSMWNIDLLSLPEAWEHTTGGQTSLGDTIVIAILDSGCDWQHPDLSANIWVNRAEIPDNQQDDDLNGYVDDYRGWSVSTENDSLEAEPHGTSVAGIIGAVGNNNKGVVGINWNIKLMNLSPFRAGMSVREREVVRMYDYVATMRKLYNQTNGQKGAFVVATNASFGIDNAWGEDFPIWCGIYDSLGKLGILNTVATSNLSKNIDLSGDMPATCGSDFVIAVTETDRYDVLNASYGARNVDVSAPADVYTTIPNNRYYYIGGTSAASPHVAGAIGLLMSYPALLWAQAYKNAPSETALWLKNVLLQTAERKENLKNKSLSGGRLQIGQAMQRLVEVYSVPEKTKILKIFPNPAQNQLQIQLALAEAGNFGIEIINPLGQVVDIQSIKTDFPTQNIWDLDISRLKNGWYMLRLSGEKESQNLVFVKI
jgi:subtilisin family serine protease